MASIEDANDTVCAVGDISNHPQEGPRPVLQKIPHTAIWESAEKFKQKLDGSVFMAGIQRG